MKADKEIQDIYKKSCQSDLDHYAELCALGIDHDSAGYATPQGLRNDTDHQRDTLPVEAYDWPKNLPKKYG